MLKVREWIQEAMEASRTVGPILESPPPRKQLVILEFPDTAADEHVARVIAAAEEKLEACGIPHEILALHGAAAQVLDGTDAAWADMVDKAFTTEHAETAESLPALQSAVSSHASTP
jgi:hypothetical protein